MLAERFQLPLVMIRKKGKLPDETTFEASYELEYGVATLSMRRDILKSDDIVFIVDDVLATGGTLQAAIELIRNCGVQSIYVGVLVELLFLK
jgi:adenine phosphoribosyltransferase